MNKKHFKEAVDEIHVDENIKVKTLNKIKEKKRYKIKYVVSLATMVLVIVITAFFSSRNNLTKPIIVETLPTVENFENLYKLVKESASKKSYFSSNDRFLSDDTATDSVMQETTTTNSETKKDYSETNVQVEGVDESDIVKTDGNYIYYVSNSKIVIVNAQDAKNLQIEAEIEYEKQDESRFYPQEIYLKENKLIVVGTKYYNIEQEYNYYNTNYSVAKVYNIENKKEIALEREVEIEGNYLSSRMIDNNIYLIANKAINLYRIIDEDFSKVNEEDFQVEYKDTAVNSGMCKIAYDSIYYIPEGEYTSYINIVAFSVKNSNEEASTKSYLGAGNEVYCSKNNLYITNTMYEYKDYGFYQSRTIETAINKFKLDGTDVKFEAQGIIPGEPLNQFSMDENEGYFRIATTDSKNWNNKSDTNNLYVLDEGLNIVGKIEDLAKGERIYSVRFMGKRAYMVTFVETDPLFVIDLSEPTSPTVLGELKIPGFSNYLHPYDETHIIGFGQDTEVIEEKYGTRVTTTGMKMALFDVSDPNNPKEMYVEKIGEQGTYSELLNNHKALLFSKEKDIIAFPIKIRENNYKYKFQGAIVYGLTLENGFKLKGQITHKDSQSGTFKYDSKKEVERIIYIDNQLFTLSKGLIKAVDMETMEELSSVEIEVIDERYYYYID